MLTERDIDHGIHPSLSEAHQSHRDLARLSGCAGEVDGAILGYRRGTLVHAGIGYPHFRLCRDAVAEDIALVRRRAAVPGRVVPVDLSRSDMGTLGTHLIEDAAFLRGEVEQNDATNVGSVSPPE